MTPKILKSSFLTVVPVLVWNIIFYRHLPDLYHQGTGWEQFPLVLEYIEQGFRIATFVLLIFLMIEVKSKFQRLGLLLYFGGIIIYFLSWIMQITEPTSEWSLSPVGFTALAFTPLIWLLGIGMMSKARTERTKFLMPVYYIVATLFILIHTFHALIVYHD